MKYCIPVLAAVAVAGCACAPTPDESPSENIQTRVFQFAKLPTSARIIKCRAEPVSEDRKHQQFRYPKGAYIEACSFEVEPEQFVFIVPKSYYAQVQIRDSTDAGALVHQLASELPASMNWELSSQQHLQLILADATHQFGVVMTVYCRCGRPSEYE